MGFDADRTKANLSVAYPNGNQGGAYSYNLPRQFGGKWRPDLSEVGRTSHKFDGLVSYDPASRRF